VSTSFDLEEVDRAPAGALCAMIFVSLFDLSGAPKQ
jgi:hypothetical protein